MHLFIVQIKHSGIKYGAFILFCGNSIFSQQHSIFSFKGNFYNIINLEVALQAAEEKLLVDFADLKTTMHN